MPLVSPSERNPARAFPARIGWGFLRDGDLLRICRLRAGGSVQFYNLTLDAWKSGAEPVAQFRRDGSKGARVAVGLEPHRVLLCELESPFSDVRKSAEIWPSLLDARIPFSLEECQVAFLEPRRENNGLRCIAAAARESDLRDVVAEWQALGIVVDLLLPEALLLEGEGARVWQGQTRSVFVATRGENWLGAGASLDPNSREKALARFLAAWGLEQARRIGPAAENSPDPQVLEKALAAACIRPAPRIANLRAGTLASPRMSDRLYRSRRTLRVAAILAILFWLAGPFLLLQKIRSARQITTQDISRLYQSLTGRPSPAAGQERLLASRYVEQEWMPLREKAQTLANPALTGRLAFVISAAATQGLQLRGMQLDSSTLQLQLQGPETSVRAFRESLRGNGWTCDEARPVSGDFWSLSGELSP
jgi:hypothetical protein